MNMNNQLHNDNKTKNNYNESDESDVINDLLQKRVTKDIEVQYSKELNKQKKLYTCAQLF